MMLLATGEIIENRYRIVKLLGQGGMGAVYKAWDIRLNRPVALKEMTPQPGLLPELLAQLRQQFESEAQVLATLVHPYLVRVTDYFVWHENQYLVMDFVEGEDLATRIVREGAQSEPELRLWMAQLLEALDYCHKKGVLHRDIKPQNIIITPENRAVLVDFGLVKLWDPNDPHTKTVMRGAGTPEYAPPEQYDLGSGHTDPRSDVYALGATLYHAITGRIPPTATQRMANPATFLAPRRIKVELSSALEQLILRAMAVAMPERFQSAAAMGQALRALPALHGATVVVPVQREIASPPYRPPTAPPVRPPTIPPAEQSPVPQASRPATFPPAKPAKRRRSILTLLFVVVGSVLGCGLLAGLGWGAWSWLATIDAPLATPSVTLPATTVPATFTPEAVSGFSDDFSDSKSGWWVGRNANGSVRYENEELLILNYTAADAVTLSIARRHFADSIMDVESRLVQGSDNNWHVFYCRYTPSNFYALLYSADGYYTVFKMQDNEGVSLQEAKSSNAIRQGVGATNAVRLSCVGDQLRFWINDTLLVDLKDDTLTEGDIALGVIALDDEFSEVAFDNLVVTVP